MKWITTQPRRLNQGEVIRRSPKGVVVKRFLSPYDVPDAVRATVREGNIVELQFRYMEEEEPTEVLDTIVFQSAGVAQLGRHSDRLYSLSVRSESPESALTQAEGLISNVANTRPSARQKYDVARRALDATRQQVLECLLEQNAAAT